MIFNADTVYALYSKVQESTPLIHNITNYVVMQQTANALLAIGASPVMAHALEEVEEMTTLAAALVVNIGTLSPPWCASMQVALATAKRLQKPIVFDPVGAGATRYRTEISRQIVNDFQPTVVRGNPSEIAALFSTAQQTRGVDSTSEAKAVLVLAQQQAKARGIIITLSGAVDYITDGDSTLSISNGSNLMTKVTGMGCTASALTGALLTTQANPLFAAAAAMALNGIAGQLAAATASGLGSFQLHFLDHLSRLTHETISEYLQFKTEF